MSELYFRKKVLQHEPVMAIANTKSRVIKRKMKRRLGYGAENGRRKSRTFRMGKMNGRYCLAFICMDDRITLKVDVNRT